MNYSLRTIGDVTETLIDYRGKTPVKAPSGVKLITAKVVKDGFINDGNHEYIAADTYDGRMTRGFPRQWDILITTEAPLGEVAQLRTKERVALAQRIILLRGNPNIIDQNYYFQCLKSPIVQNQLLARSTGTTVLGIKQSELRQVGIPLYPLPVQRKIAAVLSAYDDLLVNNSRRIQILEEMAQALYREWFVHFRFPGHEQSKMVETAMGLFPEGWEMKKLGDVACEVRRSININQIDPETPYVGLEHIPRRSIALHEWGKAKEVQSTKLRFDKGDILFGKIRPYFHKVSVAPIAGVCSSDAIVIKAKQPEYYAVTLCCVTSDDFVREATQTSQGTKMPRANWDVLTKFPLAMPPMPLLSRFDGIIIKAVGQVENLTMKNRNLRQTRDLLLPKLISGEVAVADLEIVG